MREIKFRAWDDQEKKMRNVSCMFWNTLEWYISRFELDGKDMKVGMPIMQYTGLKDKNEKEIYEGDLIQNEDGRICEVRWHQRSGQWDSFVRKTIKHDSSSGFSTEEWWHCIEVIGNIYENSELLKEVK